MDIPAFRRDFPEFSDTSVYPTPQVEFWAVVAEKMVLPKIWKTLTTQGVMLYVAHELVLASQATAAAKSSGVPGTFAGVANSKTVGSVSAAYDSTSTSEKDAGYWNLTNYGKQFIRLARIFGAGCIQL